MQNLDTIFFYAFSCSTVLVYGIGLEKTFIESKSLSRFLIRLPGLFLDSLLSVTALWFLVTRVLLPFNLGYLIPMTSIFMCGFIHMIVSVLFPVVRKTPSSELFLFFGTVFLSLSEAISYIDSLYIVLGSILSFCLITVILFTIRERIASSEAHQDWKGMPHVLVSMGLLCIVLYASDVSWYLTEVFK